MPDFDQVFILLFVAILSEFCFYVWLKKTKVIGIPALLCIEIFPHKFSYSRTVLSCDREMDIRTNRQTELG